MTAAAGLGGFRQVSGGAEKSYIIEVTGSGVGTWDFDNDGLVDIYLVNGSTLDAVRNGTPAPRAALYRNNGNGTFTDVTTKMGVANERWGQGVCVGDIDNDGVEDIYVANFGKNRLYRHTSRGTFEDIAEKAGVAVDSWSTGCAFGDYDGDGWLDLFVAGYVSLDLAHLPPAGASAPQPSSASAPARIGDAATTMATGTGVGTGGGAGTATGTGTGTGTGARDASQPPAGAGMGASYSPGSGVCLYRGERVICGPRGLKGAPDHLFHNNHDGTFTEVSTQAGVADVEGRYGFGVGWADLDDDGRLDLVVANDSGPNYIYRNLGNGRFEDVSYQSGAALDGDGRTQAHMGLAIGDYDNDGRDDIHITNFADDFNVLYHNDGKLTFSDVSFASGMAPVTMPFLGWGTNFLDYDNDGWLDLFVANGHVYPNADRRDWNTSYAQRALLFRNLNGRRFEEIGAAAGPALTTPRVSRGAAITDLDNDGALDIVINNLDAAPTVAHNVATTANRGHWLTLTLRGDPSRNCPRDAIGSVIFLTAGGRRLRAEVASGRGQISQSDLRVHFGLGDATSITRLEVRWANAGTALVEYPIDRIDTMAVIDQASGRVTLRENR